MVTDDFGDDDFITPSVFMTLVFLFFSGILLFLALLYRQTDAAIFALILVVSCVGIRTWSRLGTRGISCRLSVSRKKLFPGETLIYHVRVRNTHFLPVSVKIRTKTSHFLHEGQSDVPIVNESGLLWNQEVFFQQTLAARRRGVYRIGSPMMAIGDFFGLFPIRKPMDQSIHIVVYPRIVPLKPLPLLRRVLFGKPGRASPVMDPVYVQGTRDYQSFSPSRHIHWKASARLSKLQEKIFEHSEQNKILLILDGGRFLEEEARDSFEQSVEVIASFASLLVSEQYSVGFITNCRRKYESEKELPVVRFAIQLPELFHLLAEIEMQTCREMDALLAEQRNIPWDMTGVYFGYERDSAGFRAFGQAIPVVEVFGSLDTNEKKSLKRAGGNRLSDFLM